MQYNQRWIHGGLRGGAFLPPAKYGLRGLCLLLTLFAILNGSPPPEVTTSQLEIAPRALENLSLEELPQVEQVEAARSSTQADMVFQTRLSDGKVIYDSRPEARMREAHLQQVFRSLRAMRLTTDMKIRPGSA